MAIVLVVIGVGVMVALGSIALGPKPTLIAVGVPVAVAATLYVTRKPLVMVVTMVVVEVTNLSGVVDDRSPVSIFKISLGLGLLTVGVALCDPVMRGRLNRGTLFCVGLVACYLVTQLLAALGSQDAEISITTLKDSAVDCVFLVVLLVLAQLSGRPWAIAAAVVVPLALLSILCLVSQVVFEGTASFGGFATVTESSGELVTTLRYGGPLPDSNFWGRNLIMGLPLAGALIVRTVRSGRHSAALGWAGAMLALLSGVYLTQSRGTLLSTAVVFLVWVLASGATARRRGLMSLPLVAVVLLVPGIGNRLVALIADVSDSAPGHAVDPSILGRRAAQETAWAMFRDRPMFGFGPGAFTLSIPRYAGMVPTAVLDPAGAPHNLYAQLAAETGIVGLVGWLIFVAGFIGCIAIRVVRLSAGPADSDRSLAGAVLAALVGWSFASIFLHLAEFRTFAIMLALAGALASTPGPSNGDTLREGLGRIREVLLGILAGMAAAAAVLAVSTTETHTVSQKVTIMPTEQMAAYYAYALDLRSRDTMLPTYAAMMVANTPGVEAVADSVRGVITISVTDTEKRSESDLDIAMAKARAQLAQFGANAWYGLAPVGQIQQTTSEGRSPWWTAVAFIAGAVVALVATGTARRWLARRSKGKVRR